ncbi:MAG: hypothetical protein E7173_03610 [Firmicutes bacterium]|nr:hypothetical protein [Bacillota bacterium]
MNQQIDELIHSKENVLFIFDFDGTMIEAKYDENTVLGCKNQACDALRRNLQVDVYEKTKPLKRTQDMVRTIYLNNKKAKVLSKVSDSIEVLNKMKHLHNNYPQIRIDDFIGVTEYEQKAVVLEYYSQIYDKVVYIDDYLDFLLKLEDTLTDINNIKYFHISSLFLD